MCRLPDVINTIVKKNCASLTGREPSAIPVMSPIDQYSELRYCFEGAACDTRVQWHASSQFLDGLHHVARHETLGAGQLTPASDAPKPHVLPGMP